jgi:repressor LexA
MNKDLTRPQKKVLEFIRERVRDAGAPPTIREIGKRFGFQSTGTVRDYLRALEKKGYLRRQSGRARGIELAPELRGRQVPILGRVAAGLPVLAEENLEGHLDLDATLQHQKGTFFALRVQGDSMVGAGILDGDFVIVRSQETAEPRAIVVALVDGEVTVKRFAKKIGRGRRKSRKERGRTVKVPLGEGPGIWLLPENPTYSPIPVTEETRILGEVVTLVRDYE